MVFRRIVKVAMYIGKIVLIVLACSLVIIIWSLMFSEKEQYIAPISISSSVVDGMYANNINSNKQTIQEQPWNYYYNDHTVAFANKIDFSEFSVADNSFVTCIVKSDGAYTSDYYDYVYVVGKQKGGLDVYMFIDQTYTKQSIEIASPIVGLAFIDYKIFAIALSTQYTVEVYWLTQKAQEWEITTTYSTEYRIEKILPLHTVQGMGVFVPVKGHVVLFSNSMKDDYLAYSSIDIQSTKGNKEFYVVSYIENENQYYEVLINNNFAIPFRSKKYTNNDFFAQTLSATDDMQIDNQYVEGNFLTGKYFVVVSSELRTFGFITSNVQYSVTLP